MSPRTTRRARCQSLSTALDAAVEPRVRVTHPFHPWVGQEFVFVAIRPAWGEDRVFLFDEDGVQRSLPARWTDAVVQDAFVALSGGRSAFRVADLLALSALLDGLRGSVGGREL
jgi:hypothetical protein